jgi:hypothetical protein
VRCPELRGDVTKKGGKWVVFCKECKKDYSYSGWGQHIEKSHANRLPNNRDATGTDAKDGDDPDDDADQLGQRAAGVGDVVSTQKAPKPRYGQKKAEPKPAASKRGHGTQHAKQAKTKVAPPKKTKTKPE